MNNEMINSVQGISVAPNNGIIHCNRVVFGYHPHATPSNGGNMMMPVGNNHSINGGRVWVSAPSPISTSSAHYTSFRPTPYHPVVLPSTQQQQNHSYHPYRVIHQNPQFSHPNHTHHYLHRTQIYPTTNNYSVVHSPPIPQISPTSTTTISPTKQIPPPNTTTTTTTTTTTNTNMTPTVVTQTQPRNLNDENASLTHTSEEQKINSTKKDESSDSSSTSTTTMIQTLEKKVHVLLSESKCSICLENRKSTLFSPCNHMSTCLNCAQAIKVCPLCRKRIRRKTTVFW